MTDKRVAETMQKIARRRPGKKKLVYDKATKSVVAVDNRGNKYPVPFDLKDEANMI